ncbi:hypothetical protein FACS1894132_11580 [Clostridia bacterium]|nr:hypothetical protein FACS1894132_11580 [Clostridia bacterium]
MISLLSRFIIDDSSGINRKTQNINNQIKLYSVIVNFQLYIVNYPLSMLFAIFKF